MRLTMLVPIFMLTAAACTPVPVEAPPDELPADACGAEALQYLVGQPVSVLSTMTFPNTTRFIEPGMAVTMDYRADRLNIRSDTSFRIAQVYCG